MKPTTVQIQWYLNTIVAKFNNRRLILYPHRQGITIIFRRALTAEERATIGTPDEKILRCAGTALIEGKIVETDINLTTEASMVMSEIILKHAGEILARRIVNSAIQDEAKVEALMILNGATIEDMEEMEMYLNNNDDVAIHGTLDTIKRSLCQGGMMTYSENDHFGKPLN